MGYTHYWGICDIAKWAEVWPQFIKDAQHIVSSTSVELVADGFEGSIEQPPILNIESGIELNGKADPHDVFMIHPDGDDLGFCKTARKPYDEVVTAILLRPWQLAGDAFSIGSDGFWEEWKEGRELVLKLWPNDDLVCPWKKVSTTQE